MERTLYPDSLFSYSPSTRLPPLFAARETMEGRRTSASNTSAVNLAQELTSFDRRRISEHSLVMALSRGITRDRALRYLAENTEIHKDLGPILCNSPGTLTIIVQEIISAHYRFCNSQLSEQMTTRVGHALTLLHCVALHSDTKIEFMKADLLRCMYPFLESTKREKCHEHLRVSSLGVVAALVKFANVEVISFLTRKNIFSPCLTCMEVGGQSSKLVATFIVQKILMTAEGIKHCCQIGHRFADLDNHFRQMVVELVEQERPSQELLKTILRCYLRFSENPRGVHGLGPDILNKLKHATVKCSLHEDPSALHLLKQLLSNVSIGQQLGSNQLGSRLIPLRI